jgi:hypothetical protein
VEIEAAGTVNSGSAAK